MGNQIIRMPSGKYAIWSSIVDDFVFVNATEQDIVDYYVEKEIRQIRWDVGQKIIQLEAGKPSGNPFTLTWEEALQTMDEVHGKDRVTQFIEEFVPDHNTGRGDGKPDPHQQPDG
jgi:hypothetical protein